MNNREEKTVEKKDEDLRSGRQKVASFVGTLALAGPWTLLIYQLSVTWETNEQYAHGYLVPLLCLFMVLKGPAWNSISPELSFSGPMFRKASLLIGAPLLLIILPIWAIRGANSDWRLLNIVLFGVVFLITITVAYDQGGWKRVKPLLFPLLFFAVAIPWPLATDLKLTQWFQEKISSIIVDVLLILEHEAKLQGTVIDVGFFGQIGVDQACSGIHGLQASIVVTLFLGAYYGFGVINRIVFVLAGILVSLAMNLFRAFILSYIKVKGKGELLERPLFVIGDWQAPVFHDIAGWIETGIIFVIIIILARMVKGGLFLHTMGTNQTNWANLRFSPPIAFSLASMVIVSGTVLGVEYHYSSREEKMERLPKISMNLKDPEIMIIRQNISRQVASQLHFKEASSIQWQEKYRMIFSPNKGDFKINPNDEYWQLFEANWDSGGACTAVLSTHSPVSCLPLTGLVQIEPKSGENPTLIPIRIIERDVLFEVYEFSKNDRKLFVFRSFWPKKIPPNQPNLFPSGGYNFKGRIKSALKGNRNVGGTMIALSIANVDSQQTAINKLQALANQRLSFGNKGVQ